MTKQTISKPLKEHCDGIGKDQSGWKQKQGSLEAQCNAWSPISTAAEK